MTKMDLGLFLPTMSGLAGVPGDVAAAARHADDLGVESVWAVDQLIAGTGSPLLDSTVALAAAAAVTRRVRLGFGVMILPLHPVVWAAKQVASLQHVSDGRVILGVGVGGDRHEQSWVAAGVPRGERGRRTDAALRVLPDLISGKAVRLDGRPDSPAIRLAPAAPVPPIVVGGMSEAAIARAARYGDGWFPMPVAPAAAADARARIAAAARARGRPTPPITLNMMFVLSGDPAVPDDDTLTRALTDVDGSYGIPADQVSSMVIRGNPDQVAARLAEYAQCGAQRVVATLPAGDWRRQAELLAEAHALLG
jgi:alkanesulfonate monooxygenase SsuD/methylene tetrahydromethanopterin reductase-like flavin-dependent oxidoreductase (luciferase family)